MEVRVSFRLRRGPLLSRGIVPQDRAALALILGGHDVAEVAYLEQISIRDVHRRLRRGLTSLGPILFATSNEDDNQKNLDITRFRRR